MRSNVFCSVANKDNSVEEVIVWPGIETKELPQNYARITLKDQKNDLERAPLPEEGEKFNLNCVDGIMSRHSFSSIQSSSLITSQIFAEEWERPRPNLAEIGYKTSKLGFINVWCAGLVQVIAKFGEEFGRHVGILSFLWFIWIPSTHVKLLNIVYSKLSWLWYTS